MRKSAFYLLMFLASLCQGAVVTERLVITGSTVSIRGTTYYWDAGTGTNGQFLKTDGAAQPTLTFGTASGSVGSVYPATSTVLLNSGFNSSTGTFTAFAPGVMHIVQTSSNVTTAQVSLSTEVTGTLAAANFPALTGDVTTLAGGLETIANSSFTKTFDVNVSSLDIINTTAETTYYTYVIPANTLGTNRCIKWNIIGELLNATGSSQSFEAIVKVSTYGVFDSGALAFGSSTSTRGFTLNGEVCGSGATNRQVSTGLWLVGNAAGNNQGGAGGAGAAIVSAHTAISIDSTSAQTMVFTIDLGSANLTHRVGFFYGRLERH